MTRSRQAFTEATRMQLDLWGEQFAALERRIDEWSVEGRAALRRRLARLQKKKRAMKRRLQEAAHEATADWDVVRRELESLMNGFRSLAAEVHDEVHSWRV